MVQKLIDVNEDLWQRFRSHCVRNRFKTGDVMNDVLENFLKEVDEDGHRN